MGVDSNSPYTIFEHVDLLTETVCLQNLRFNFSTTHLSTFWCPNSHRDMKLQLFAFFRGAPYNLKGGGATEVFIADKLFISTRLDGELKMSNCIWNIILYVYMEQLLKQIISFMQNLPEIISFKNTPALPTWILNGGPLSNKNIPRDPLQHKSFSAKVNLPL